MTQPRRGAFIVIEGLDRSGKTTQAKLLHDRLLSEGKEAKLIKFPDRTTSIGKMIDGYLRSESELDDHAIHLLFSANRWEVASAIQTHLKAGTTVVCDRYAFSGIAFTYAKSLLPGAPAETREKLTYEWCRAPDVGLPAPDLTLFLDVSPEIARTRGGYGDERYEKEEHQLRVRDIFEQIRTNVQLDDMRWLTIDADRDKDVVHGDIVNVVTEVTNDQDLDTIKTLWTSCNSKCT